MTKQEAANLKLVEEWWRTVLVAHHIDQMTKFAEEDMIQHNPNAPNGLAPLRKIFGSRPAHGDPGVHHASARARNFARRRGDDCLRSRSEGSGRPVEDLSL